MKSLKTLFVAFAGAAMLASCTTYHNSMREPNARVEFTRDNFELSGQVSASATRTTILMIDWSRLFTKKFGTVEGGGSGVDIASIPVIGSYIADPTANYALYELMTSNPGYDVVFYPQYASTVKRPFLGLGFIVRISDVKVTARLAKMK